LGSPLYQTIQSSDQWQVDKALNAAGRGEWKFRVNVSLQQSNESDCGAFVLYNAFCLSHGINPRAYSFNPDEWQLKWAKEMMQPGRDVAFGASILSGMQNTATLGEPAKSDLSVLPGMADRLKAEKPNADSTLSDHTSLTVVNTTKSPSLVAGKVVETPPPTNDEMTIRERISGPAAEDDERKRTPKAHHTIHGQIEEDPEGARN
jgi:hypothetical protein